MVKMGTPDPNLSIGVPDVVHWSERSWIPQAGHYIKGMGIISSTYGIVEFLKGLIGHGNYDNIDVHSVPSDFSLHGI